MLISIEICVCVELLDWWYYPGGYVNQCFQYLDEISKIVAPEIMQLALIDLEGASKCHQSYLKSNLYSVSEDICWYTDICFSQMIQTKRLTFPIFLCITTLQLLRTWTWHCFCQLTHRMNGNDNWNLFQPTQQKNCIIANLVETSEAQILKAQRALLPYSIANSRR